MVYFSICKGNDIATAIYASGWEKTCDRSVRKSVQIILHRAQRTVAIKSLFHEFGMEALTDVSIPILIKHLAFQANKNTLQVR